jgi:hypothetical protein
MKHNRMSFFSLKIFTNVKMPSAKAGGTTRLMQYTVFLKRFWQNSVSRFNSTSRMRLSFTAWYRNNWQRRGIFSFQCVCERLSVWTKRWLNKQAMSILPASSTINNNNITNPADVSTGSWCSYKNNHWLWNIKHVKKTAAVRVWPTAAGLDVSEKRKISCACQEFNPRY